MKRTLLASIFALFIGSAVQAQCVANFTSSINGLNVTFTNTSTGFGTSATWSWNFGDTQTGNTMSPSHTYAGAGTYTVFMGGADFSVPCGDTAAHVIVITSSGINELGSANGSIGSYPNPFSATTNVSYTLKEAGAVNISVYDILGNNVAVIENNASKAPGSYETVYDGSALSEGIYFLKLTLNGRSSTTKMTVSR